MPKFSRWQSNRSRETVPPRSPLGRPRGGALGAHGARLAQPREATPRMPAVPHAPRAEGTKISFSATALRRHRASTLQTSRRAAGRAEACASTRRAEMRCGAAPTLVSTPACAAASLLSHLLTRILPRRRPLAAQVPDGLCRGPSWARAWRSIFSAEARCSTSRRRCASAPRAPAGPCLALCTCH